MKKKYIQLTEETFSFDKVGDILKVNRFIGHGAYVLNKDLPRPQKYVSGNKEWCYLEYNYKKLENYKGGNMTKADLKDGDIVTLRNGDRLLLLDNGDFYNLGEDSCHYIDDLGDYEDNLKTCDTECMEYDIIKVERPVKYETVFEREEEAQELTVDEISERLGYKIKVVGVEK